MEQKVFFSVKIQHVCRMYLAIFLPLYTNNQDCKQKKVDYQWKSKLETLHGPFFTKHPIHFRRPQEFQSLVYTVYVVGKALGSIIFQPLLLNLTICKILHGNGW